MVLFMKLMVSSLKLIKNRNFEKKGDDCLFIHYFNINLQRSS